MKPVPPSLSKYPYVVDISTRWSDNDQYGHLNNAVYYQFYDALINSYMMERCQWHPQGKSNASGFVPAEDNANAIGLVVSSGTEYFELIRGFPAPLKLGLAVTKLGKSSVEYEIGVFQDSDKAKAVGKFIHVFVDRSTEKTLPNGMPASIRNGLARLVINPPAPAKL
ncbi:hypothetical protein TRVA0_034S01750 [Trichomonascus vanleenenianus]|uniref:acyl-CoA thioesterase n=1 Tax=Trichomonascus vanleenenianus TaxID=2268995 RepID=UPI003ECB8546